MRIGEKLRRLRLRRGLTVDVLGQRSNLSGKYISLVERDATSPSISTLDTILSVLGSNLKEFFDDNTPDQFLFHEEDSYVCNIPHGTIRYLTPTEQTKIMEPAIVEMQPGAETEWTTNEECGWVISGWVHIDMGDRVEVARSGDAYYCTMPHRIQNTNKTPCRYISIGVIK